MAPAKSRSPTLEEAQKALKSLILHDGESNDAGFDHAERLSVYAEGFFARLHEALQESYELVYRVVGEEESYALIHDYLHDFTPRSYNITEAGASFPEFLERHSVRETFPYLPDLARFEWAIVRAFHSKTETPLNRAALQELSPEQWDRVRFSFQPAVSVISSPWPIYDLWKARKKPDAEFPVPGKSDRRACHIVVYRSQFDVMTLEIETGEAELLRLLMNGSALGYACAQSSGRRSPADVTKGFARWVQLGLIVQIQVS
ncbi:MAG TPA: DNA-binding domain-containing protein [Bdellovibrionota bacterium]|nr:DNA-binding domain-containing protein [Bdellovibrionota bacterium]